LYAAIRRDLLDWRDQLVEVCTESACVVVTIIDCNCGKNANLIDLYSDAFLKLAPLSAGRIRIAIRKVLQLGQSTALPPGTLSIPK
jgi:hypothetical protein